MVHENKPGLDTNKRTALQDDGSKRVLARLQEGPPVSLNLQNETFPGHLKNLIYSSIVF